VRGGGGWKGLGGGEKRGQGHEGVRDVRAEDGG
jgi:hypothetical protein